MCKKMLSLALAALMVLAAVPFVRAAAIVETGSCGENMTYTLDANGLLTISGEGEMEDYD